jgi:hypothetical protein
VRFAQGRRARIAILGFDTTAREADLARVILEVARAFREQHREALVTLDERDENGRQCGLARELIDERVALLERSPRHQPSIAVMDWRAVRQARANARAPVDDVNHRRRCRRP